MKPTGVLWPGEQAISTEALEKLQRKADNHDRFVEMLREMGRRQPERLKAAKSGDQYARGWLRCLRELADLLVPREDL